MEARLNDIQIVMLRWIADGHPDGEATNPQRLTARALSTRRLVNIKGRGPWWHAELTDAGCHYVEHDEYPPDHFGPEPKPEAEAQAQAQAETGWLPRTDPLGAGSRRGKPEADVTVDSPAGKRRRRGRPTGDTLFKTENPDTYDEKNLGSGGEL